MDKKYSAILELRYEIINSKLFVGKQAKPVDANSSPPGEKRKDNLDDAMLFQLTFGLKI